MDPQRTIHLLVSRAMDSITRLALRAPATFTCEPPSAPHKRLLLVSSLSLCLALALVWLGAGLPGPDGPHVAYAAVPIRYVAITGTDTGICNTPAVACLTPQYAADQAFPTNQIRIASGTYTGVTARAGTTQLAYISKTLTIQGGYTTTDSFAVSDPVTNPTILDAGGGGRVFFISGVDGDVSNLTVQNGNSGAVGTNGGGINASNALTLTNVTLISNTANLNGGGAYVVGRREVERRSGRATAPWSTMAAA